ncbi:MAG TPA: ribosome maturation factor RimM [Spongiibacteraceae bacterium]
MLIAPADLVVIGRFTGIFGLKGWLKVYSYTDPLENFLKYNYCQIQRHDIWQAAEIAEGRVHGKGMVVRLKGIDDPEQAAAYTGCDIAVAATQLPLLPESEFYWRQLEGLQVIVDHPQRGRLALGQVDHLLETGANDVLVVKGDEHSIDRRERLIPYLEQVVLEIDLAAQLMRVDWDPDF